MIRLFQKSRLRAGLPPGTPVHTGDEKTTPVIVSVIDYGEDRVTEQVLETPDAAAPFRESKDVSWINVTGVHDAHVIKTLGEIFELHSLVLEDIVNTSQRPKVEFFDDYVLVVVTMFYYDGETRELVAEQVSIVCGKTMVITFQEREGDIFEPLRNRIRHKKGRVRFFGTDYLTYALIDSIVDHYYVLLEDMQGRIEVAEEQLEVSADEDAYRTVHHCKKELLYFRRALWPLRENIAVLQRGESPFIGDSVEVFFRDVYDHTVHVIEAIETFQDVLAGLRELYLSSLSNRMNEVMKVLTIFASIFIPLTFIAGIYGMNFEFMPELAWRWGYFFVWGVMGAVFCAMVLYFRKKKWL